MAEEILRKVLMRIVEEQNFIDYDLKIAPICSGGASFSSTLYNVTVTEGENVVHMFAKVAAFGEKMRDNVPKIYETEQFAYNNLMKVYDRLQEEHKVHQTHRFKFPKLYGCNGETNEETIVLENLVEEGYRAYDRSQSSDWVFAKSAVKEMAKMHALAFAYSKYHAVEYKKIVNELNFELDLTTDQMSTYFDTVIIKTIEFTRRENKDKIKRFFETFDRKQFSELYKCCKSPVIGHGDFKPSNMMYKILPDGTMDIIIVDLQTLQSASPIVDLMYFIYTGSDEEFRAQYYDQLIEHYYTELHASMTRLHLEPDEIYSRADFEYELKEKAPYTLVLATIALPIVTVEADEALTPNEHMDMSSFFVDNVSQIQLTDIVHDHT